MNIETMIEIRKGQIQNAPQSLQVDAIVNCANPTLMGSDSNFNGVANNPGTLDICEGSHK